MISIQQQFIFVHIPKTAGNALQSVLKQYSEDTLVSGGNKDGVHRFGLNSSFGTVKHSTLADYLAVLGPEAFWSKRRFTCVRNPWDRAVSFYFSPHRGQKHWNREEFIDLLNEIHPMTAFLSLPTDAPGRLSSDNLDYIIRYENLNEDFTSLCDFLGIERQKIPVLNKADRLSYLDYYDSELIERVADRFRTDIELFGYEDTVKNRFQA